MTLSTTVLGITFRNPTLLASGIWGLKPEDCRKAIDGGAGGITVKSFGLDHRTGHPEPIIVRGEHYTLNAVGLPSFGAEYVEKEFGPLIAESPVPVILSMIASTANAFGETARTFAALKPAALEANISCPNVEDSMGKPFSYAADTAAAATRAAKKGAGSLPLFVKLSPNVPDIGRIAAACAEAGADGVTLVNTLGPGMAIDLETRRPVLSNKMGGVSGPAIRPVAIRCVADVYAATEGKLPIIGTGGVSKGEDAIELMMAGASLIGIGTAVWDRGYDVFGKVAGEMGTWCAQHGVADIAELTGSMHRA